MNCHPAFAHNKISTQATHGYTLDEGIQMTPISYAVCHFMFNDLHNHEMSVVKQSLAP